MENKILLFNMNRITYNSLELAEETPGLLAIAAFLETKGYDSFLYHGEPSSVRTFLKNQLQNFNILAVGFYCDFENQVEVSFMSNEISRDYGIPVILGGPQVTGFDREYLLEARCLAAIFGEGEITFWHLLDCLYRQKGDWRELDGIMYVDEEGKFVRKPPGILPDIDELPLPAYHLWVNKPLRNSSYVITGRGCPYNCAFCYEGSLARRLRLRSVDKVLCEVETVLEREPYVKYIVFGDDTFTVSRERVKTLCKGLSSIREKRDFIWFCEGHVKNLSRWPELLSIMTETGLARLQIGIESGEQKVLDLYGKGITIEEIENVIKAASEAEVPQIVGCFITGGSFESSETLEKNKAFCEKLLELAPGILFIGNSPLMPYPETDIRRYPEKYGLKILDPEGITTFSDYPVMETSAMTREDIALAQQELVLHIINTMKRLFREGKVPVKRILNSFRLLPYGAVSQWYRVVYSKTPFVEGYYTLLARKAVRPSGEIPPSEISVWRPQRIMELWQELDFSEGFPKIGKHVISPLEFKLLLYSTGKLRLKEVLDRIYEEFAERFENREEYESEAKAILKIFEDRYWLAYAPL